MMVSIATLGLGPTTIRIIGAGIIGRRTLRARLMVRLLVRITAQNPGPVRPPEKVAPDMVQDID